MFYKGNHLLKSTCFISILLCSLFFMTSCGLGAKGASYYKEGMKQFQNEKYEDAEKSFQNAIDENKDKAEYFIAYGMTLIKLGKYEDAMKLFDKAISEKNNQIVLENNKQAYRGKGICSFYAKNYKDSLKWLNMALDIKESDDLNMDILQYKGEVECQLGDYDGAIETYSSIIDGGEFSSKSFLSRAFAYGRKGDVEKAQADYDTVIKKKPNEYEAYIGAFFLLSESNRKEDAEVYLDNALKIKDDSPESAISKGKIRYYKGDRESALATLEEASKNGILDAEFYLGKIYVEEKKYQEAIPYLEKFIRTDVKTTLAEAYNLLGMCYLNLEDYENALKQFELGIETKDSSNMQKLMKNEIITLEHMGDYDNAAKRAKEYVSWYKEDRDMQRELEFITTRIAEGAK